MVMWEKIVQHCQSHLIVSAPRQGLNLTEGCLSGLIEVDNFIQDTSQNSSCPSAYKCVTIKELLECNETRHSHAENAKCHPYGCSNLSLKPTITNGRSFLIAWLAERPTLPNSFGDGEKGHTEEGLYLKDDTGVMSCQLSICDQKWLDRVLLIFCWNYIPGADATVLGIIEVCPQCTPIVISRSTLDDYRLSNDQAIPVLKAVRLLANHDSSKNAVDLVTIRGIVVSKSPLIRIHGKAVFFFKLSMDASGIITVPLLGKGKGLPLLYACLPVNYRCSVSHLRATTISKGTRHPYHIFLCTEETRVVNIERACSDEEHKNRHSIINSVYCLEHHKTQFVYLMTSHYVAGVQGTVTKAIDAASGIYELDGKYRLYVSHQMDDSAMYADLRVGCVVTVYNAHYRETIGLVAIPAISCCMQSTVNVSAFSPIDTGPRQMSNPALSGSVRLLLKHKLTLNQLEWLLAVMSQLEIKFSPVLVRKKALHTVMFRLFNTPSTVSKKPLLSGRKRNIYEEFLNPSHTCLASWDDGDKQSPLWQFPLISSLLVPTMLHNKKGEEGLCCRGLAGENMTDNSDNCGCSLIRSCDQNPPMILLGYLGLSTTTGQVQIKDQTGSVDCLITDVVLDYKLDSCTRSLSHLSQDSASQNPAECCPASSSSSERAESSERKCGWTAQCLGHLIRVESFLIIQEALPLSLNKPNTKQFVAFSMKFVTCLNCTASSNVSKADNCLPNEIREDGTRCDQKGLHTHQQDLSTKACNKAETTHSLLMVRQFLLLMKSQLLTTSRGNLFFVIQVVTLSRSGCTQRFLDSKKDEVITTEQVAVRFDGESVRWYNILHPGCVYRIKGEINRISKENFLQETFSVFEHMNADKDNLLVMKVMSDVTVEHIHESSVSGDIANDLRMARSQYKDILHVSGLQEVKTKVSDGLVSFHCVIVAKCWSVRNSSSDHHDKKSKMSSEDILDGELQLSVADLGDPEITVDVVLDASVSHKIIGLLPGATVTFRRCVRSTFPDGYMYYRVVPQTSITVDSITSHVTRIKNLKKQALQAVASQDNPTTDQTKEPVLPTIATEPMEEPPGKASVEPTAEESAPRLQRFHLCDLTSSIPRISLSTVFIVKCFLQTIKSLALKWSCQCCGRKDCACSEDGEQDGEVSATVRFVVDDGSGEALVSCSKPSAIFSMLGLSQHQWGLLEQELKHCKELVWSYQRSDYRQWVVMPSPSDLEGLVSLLCSHSSIQKPLLLHCRLTSGGSNGLITGSRENYHYASSVRLECVAAFEDHS